MSISITYGTPVKKSQTIIKLFESIIPEKCRYQISAFKIEITLEKEASTSWSTLEDGESTTTMTTFGPRDREAAAVHSG